MDSTSCSVSCTQEQEAGELQQDVTEQRKKIEKTPPGTDPFDAFLQLVVDEERQVLGRPRVQVEEVLKVAGDGLLEEPVVVERLLQEAVKAGLKVQQAL